LIDVYCEKEDKQFCSEKTDFSNSYLNKKYEFNDIININEKIYFCDVHLFIDSFKDVIQIKTEDMI